MNAYRAQERFDGEVTTIVSNNANFVKGKPGEPVLISWDDADDAVPRVRPRAARPPVRRDLPVAVGHDGRARLRGVPVAAPRALARDARGAEPLRAATYQTGKPIPKELVEKIEKASTFNQGFATVEYLSTALVDMKLHLAGDADKTIDPHAFERETLAALGMPTEIVDAPPHAAVRAHLLERRLLGRLLQLPLGRHAVRRRLRGVHRGRRPLRQGRRASGCARTSSPSATRSTRPTLTARSAGATRESPR